jgi:hypothetical protein
MTTTRLLHRLAIPLALAGLLGLAGPAMACNGQTVRTIVFQAAKDGHVSDGYSVACLRQAQQAQTPDLLTYSSSDSAIRAALTRAVVYDQVPAAERAARGSASSPKRFQQNVAPVRPPSASETGADGTDGGPLARLINAGARSPDTVPLPVIVLGVLAFLMTTGGIASFVLRRRMEPARGPRPPDPR